MCLVFRYFCCVFGLLFLFACAPVPLSEEGATEPDPVQEATPQPDPAPVVEQEPADSNSESLSPDGNEPYLQASPNWEERYHQLIEFYSDAFQKPSTGIRVSLKLNSGRVVQGVVNRLTDTDIYIEIEGGIVGYPEEALAPDTARVFFESAYAHHSAMIQGRKEYQRWQQLQTVAQPNTSTPTQSNATPAPAVDVSADQEEPEDSTLFPIRPRNEGPDGRVWQVERYIRDNAVKPDSLRVKAWGKVQPHESGYKVRVQYSLESAAGLGVSHEDMMFFMSSAGRVYRRAGVK
jgi:hypothetical protein